MSLISAMIKTYKGNNLSQKEIKKLQYKRLKELVEYARNNSPYFKALYAKVGDDFSLEDLINGIGDNYFINYHKNPKRR